MINRNNEYQRLNELYRNVATDAEKNVIKAELNTVNRESLAYIDKLIEDNRHLYVSKVIKSLIPIDVRVPEPPRNDEGNITDPNFQYRWWRAHFFDNLDIFDPDMLRTHLYEEKMFDYLIKVIPQHTDTICVEIDKILAKAQAHAAVFQYILVTVFTHFYESKDIVRGFVVPENVWMHIAEKWYIPHATWAFGGNFHEYLVEQVPKRKPNLIGKRAPPMENLVVLPPEHFKAAALDTAIKSDVYAGAIIEDFRKELKSKYTVLYFWEYSCGFCKQGIQDLFNVWQELKDRDLQVITIQTHFVSRTDKGKWIDFVNEHEMFGFKWINAWSPYSYKYKELYNTATVPLMYLLDENFDIVIRNIVSEQLKDFFDNQIIKNQQ
jgi:thiol-disulfide isomerase/thioredoxin